MEITITRNKLFEATYGALPETDARSAILGMFLAMHKFGLTNMAVKNDKVVTTPQTWAGDAKIEQSLLAVRLSDLNNMDMKNKFVPVGIAAVIAQFKKYRIDPLDNFTRFIVLDTALWIGDPELITAITRSFEQQIQIEKMDKLKIKFAVNEHILIVQSEDSFMKHVLEASIAGRRRTTMTRMEHFDESTDDVLRSMWSTSDWDGFDDIPDDVGSPYSSNKGSKADSKYLDTTPANSARTGRDKPEQSPMAMAVAVQAAAAAPVTIRIPQPTAMPPQPPPSSSK